MRDELHDRLEGMVLDVQSFIDQKENPESLPQNLDSDELYVLSNPTSPLSSEPSFPSLLIDPLCSIHPGGGPSFLKKPNANPQHLC